jgi:hypothetical protein
MERLHQITRTAVLSLVFIVVAPLKASDYCSLIVRVVDPQGQRPEVVVGVQEANGRKIETDPTKEDVKFCDLGLAPVTVTVGLDGACNQVVVKNVPLYWGETSMLTVAYDWELCHERLPIRGCYILLRVSDMTGKWLDKASIDFGRVGTALEETDGSGRALKVLGPGDRVSGTVKLMGYISKPFDLSCPPRVEPLREVVIKLEKSPKQ